MLLRGIKSVPFVFIGLKWRLLVYALILDVGTLVFKLIPFLGYRWVSVEIQIQTDYDSIGLLVSDVLWQDLC